MKTVKMAGIAALMAIVILLSGADLAFDAAAEGTGEGDGLPRMEVVQEHIDDVLGGGEFIGIRNRDNDAMIGILYGTESDPNNVYVVSIFTRYLGVADIYGENGKELASGKPIPVRTIYAQRFDAIYEYEDKDSDGVWDSRRMAQGQGPNGDDNATDVSTRDPVFKKVSLHTAWTPTDVTKKDNGNGSLEWELTLTADDLGYKSPLLGLPVDLRNDLEEVSLTFHLYVEKMNVTKEDVPVYRVDVSKGGGTWNIDDVGPAGNRSYSGAVIDADVKYDHFIEGWDFSRWNDAPSLMLSTEVLFLTAVSPEVSEWLRYQYRDRFGFGNGTADFETDQGREVVGTNGLRQMSGDLVLDQSVARPRMVRKNSLGIADNWDKVGTLNWLSNVTVAGN